MNVPKDLALEPLDHSWGPRAGVSTVFARAFCGFATISTLHAICQGSFSESKPVSETGSVQQLFCVTWTLQASLSLRNQLPKSSSRLRACLQCRPLHHKSVAVAMLDLGLGVSSSKLSQAGFTAYGVVSCRSSRCRLIMTKARLCCTPSVRMDALALPCQEQFLDLGCPNCRDSLGMQDSGSSFHIAVLASLFQENEARVLACTTASFAGFFSLVRPAVNSG